ncbi:MAG TPA: D-glycero-beta-D-manno-heptose 1-phosphate adenylyltransferase [Propionibacteriaceae bacterium]|nr:D-glycero-beta-D-manno-heptose 1-phosphate adenylyltransferase [Propionibacteriaceae bacterium]
MTPRSGHLAGLVAPDDSVPGLLAAAAPRIVVVGDVILDGWWHTDVSRLCREAPAPVLELRDRVAAPGGAGNSALNASRLGGRVQLVSVVGEDEPGSQVRELLAEGDVDCGLLLTAPGTTMTKSRIVAGGQILARVDEPGTRPTPEVLDRLASLLPEAIRGAEAVLVCDHGLGTLEGAVRETLLLLLGDRGGAAPLVVVDAHEPRRWRELRADVCTPNADEALQLLGGLDGIDRVEAMRSRRAELLARTGARCVVVTLDSDGTIALAGSGFTLGTTGESALGEPGRPIVEHRTWAHRASQQQTAGAGDTFVACLTVGLAAGLTPPTALNLAQVAADIVVHREGTSVCSLDDLTAHLGGLATAVVELDELALRLDDLRREGRRIVLTNGCFDVLHRGHTRYLEQAKQLGDVLVVALNDDDSVRRLKGPDRPINPVTDRAAVLAALSCVDLVTTFSTDTAVPVVERLRPDVYAKGGDYSPEDLPEGAVVESYGGSVALLDFVPDKSTSAVVSRIRSSAATPEDERRPA